MKDQTVETLRQLNNRFYESCASSFSQTRQTAWEGWRACLPYIEEACEPGSKPRLSLLDLACGNGRFEAFVAEQLPDVELDAVAVDSCKALMEKARAPRVSFQTFDALEALAQRKSWSSRFPLCDVAVSFGFFHHIPSEDLRARALRELLGVVRPGGVAIVSLWCFLEDERLASKAQTSHRRALEALSLSGQDAEGGAPLDDLEPGDCLLGWQDAADAWRYCHSFDDAQATRLSECAADEADEIARFRSDGKSGRLNIYLVFRKH